MLPKESKIPKKKNEIVLDISWGELDEQIKQAEEAKKNKGRRRYI